MCKYVYSLYLMLMLATGFVFSMNPQDNAAKENKPQEMSKEQADKLQVEKKKVDREAKKNRAYLRKIKANEKLAPALEKIEEKINKIVTSPEFKAVIEKIANKQAQQIMQGKTFEEVKYNHVLSTAFPKVTKINPFVANVYSWMANAEQNQLLLSKLNNPQSIPATESVEKPKEEAKPT